MCHILDTGRRVWLRRAVSDGDSLIPEGAPGVLVDVDGELVTVELDDHGATTLSAELVEPATAVSLP